MKTQKNIIEKTMILCAACILQAALCNSQNLIRNGDFEQGYPVTTTEFKYTVDSTCAINVSNIVAGCDYWVCDYAATPIRFVHNAPHFVWCYDNIIPHSGSGYVGFNGNDGAYTTLINPLITGHKYKLEYYACIDSTWFAYCISQGDSVTSILFTFNESGNTFNSPLITYTGFGAWKKYDTVFTAQANSTEFDFHGNNLSSLGIYFDDISLQADSASAIKENSFNCTPPKIVLNPENNLLSVTFNNNLSNSIVICNSLGQFVFRSVIKEDKAEIPMNTQSSGIYFISIFTNNSTYTKKILISNN